MEAEIDETGYDGATNSIPPNYIDIAIGPHGEYAYDALDRLIEETSDPGSYLFGYDGVGNRISANKNQQIDSYDYQAASNQLTAINGTAQIRDAAGNLIAEGQRSFQYHQSGRLYNVMESGNEIAAYIYNAQGQRTQKSGPSTTYLYHYDQAGRLIYETASTGSSISYIWDDQIPVAQITTTDTSVDTLIYLHTDHLGTPRLATSGGGRGINIDWRWNGTGFGEGAPIEVSGKGWSAKTTIVNLRMPGQYYDQETGYFYNWNRYYDPTIGRYITSDPIGLQGGMNTYGYGLQNPLYWIDLYGLDTIVVDSNSGTLTHYGDRTDIVDDVVGNYNYTSGIDGVTDPSIPWQGPIPPGSYTLNPNEISRGGWLRSLTGDWGNYRVPLHPDSNTNTYNRDGFFLHGGVDPGSAGCIDVGLYDTVILGPNGPIFNHDGPVTVIIK